MRSEVKKNDAIVTNFDKQTDDFPPGAYNLKDSQAAKIIMSVMKKTVESELDEYLLAGKPVTIKITGSTDASPVRNTIPYKGEYGELNDKEYFLNGLFDYVSVNTKTGVKENSQLAYLRTYAVRNFITENISSLKITDNTFEHYALISSKVGAEHRRISIELIVHDAFSGKTNKQADKQVNKNIFVPYCEIDKNIPQKEKRPFVFALVIGNENYSDRQQSLSQEQDVPYAMHDAKTFAQYAKNTMGVHDDNLRLTLNATAGEMQSSINWLINKTKNAVASGKKPEIILYYAGHGLPNKDSIPFIIPLDVSSGDLSLAVSLPDLYQELSDTKAEKITIFIDACFSGGARKQNLTQGARSGIKLKPKNEVTTNNIIVFSATSNNQSAWAYDDKKHGIFTYYLLKKLQESQADISYNELFDYLKYNVNNKALDINKPSQTPEVNISNNFKQTWKELKINE